MSDVTRYTTRFNNGYRTDDFNGEFVMFADYERTLEDVGVLSRIRQQLETHNAELQRQVHRLQEISLAQAEENVRLRERDAWLEEGRELFLPVPCLGADYAAWLAREPKEAR